MSELHPIHYSLRPRMVRIPRDMARLRGMDVAAVDGLERVATSIFADCVNVGVPFGRALLAIYLSGLNHGFEASREEAGLNAEIEQERQGKGRRR